MAIEFTLICDDCGGIIATDSSAKRVRAAAQLDQRAYCGRAIDLCRPCCDARGAKLTAGLSALVNAPPVGTRRG